jgi:two-component system, sensor histidine kinase and response regulator
MQTMTTSSREDAFTLQRALDRIADLEVRIEELDAFTYAVAHELRGPLFVIDGFARNIELNDAAGLTREGRSRLRRVIDAAAQMQKLIDDFLALSRAEHVQIRRQPVALDEMVREVLRELRTPYIATRVITSELPIMQADPALARQILMNVIGNALKYSALSPEPIVQIGLDAQGSLYVTDNGIGFPMDKADSIFDPFERVTGDPAYPGTGVGLAIAQRLLRRHGGWIHAQSREGGPTTFTFSFG